MRWPAITKLFAPTRDNGVDFSLSQNPPANGSWELRFKRTPDPHPAGVNNIVPDTECKSLVALEGNGTIFKRPLPLNGPAIVAGQVVASQAIIDPAGQISFGAILGGRSDGTVDPNMPIALLDGGPF